MRRSVPSCTPLHKIRTTRRSTTILDARFIAPAGPEDAIVSFGRALALDSANAEVHYNLGTVLRDLDKFDDAAAAFRQAVARAPGCPRLNRSRSRSSETEQGCRRIGRGGNRRFIERFPVVSELPARIVVCEVRRQRTSTSVPGAVSGARCNGYRGRGIAPGRVGIHATAATGAGRPNQTHLCPPRGFVGSRRRGVAALSGCGTGRPALLRNCHPLRRIWMFWTRAAAPGLVGGLISEPVHRLDGVDLSSAMLNRAKTKNIYRSLRCGDLVEDLRNHTQSYDIILSAATLIHFRRSVSCFRCRRRRTSRPGSFYIHAIRRP